jgi:hypothetical protein
MQRRQLLLAVISVPLLAPLLATARAFERFHEPIVGLPCEGCEAVFDGKPYKLASRSRIAPIGEPGEPLTLTGQVLDQTGRPQEGVIVYAYHTDQTGVYPSPHVATTDPAQRHGRLRAWVQTNARGEYRFDTIRPGSYPGRDLPQHIHMHVIEPGRATYYIDDVMFSDDPKLTPRQIRNLTLGRGGRGIATPHRRDGVWLVRRDIVLGLSVPGYPAPGAP